MFPRVFRLGLGISTTGYKEVAPSSHLSLFRFCDGVGDPSEVIAGDQREPLVVGELAEVWDQMLRVRDLIALDVVVHRLRKSRRQERLHVASGGHLKPPRRLLRDAAVG